MKASYYIKKNLEEKKQLSVALKVLDHYLSGEDIESYLENNE